MVRYAPGKLLKDVEEVVSSFGVGWGDECETGCSNDGSKTVNHVNWSCAGCDGDGELCVAQDETKQLWFFEQVVGKGCVDMDRWMGKGCSKGLKPR